MTRNACRLILWLLPAWMFLAGCGKDDGGSSGGGSGEEKIPAGYNLTGTVKDAYGVPMQGVVVSDGLQCVKTHKDGRYYIVSDLDKARFVFVSTPSGYLPPVKNGIPQFYRALAGETLINGKYYQVNFTLEAMDDPDNFTLFFSADPQPRATSAGYDNLGYHALDCCEDMYRDMRETAQKMVPRQVIGICLGDIVHENMGLFDNYAAGLKTLGFPTYNIIGNHDNDVKGQDDDAGAIPFENHFGPRNYSFNLGDIHFLVLDNLIMKKRESDNKLADYDQGLTDDIWKWMQADLGKVSRDKTVMVCAHSPMFRYLDSDEKSTWSKDRMPYAKHGGDYAALLNKFAEVHAWAGHTHTSFNYNYPSSSSYGHVQVHTLARTTGELWTNEYLASGTPRGYTIVEVRGGKLDSWRFHPIPYQSGAYVGKNEQPAYQWRGWDYSGGVAVMKDGSGALTEEKCQMHIYPPGAYEEKQLYVNIFLYDDRWEKPYFRMEGGMRAPMQAVNNGYDLADNEFRAHYKATSSTLKPYSGYTAVKQGYAPTFFRISAPAASGTGYVTVTDRFGKTWEQKISW